MHPPSKEAVAAVGYDIAGTIETIRWEYQRRALELERRALLWRLLAGTIGFAAGMVAGGFTF